MNNINIYRPDSKQTTSKKSLNKSLSRSKYTIQRHSVTDLTLSKKQLTVHTDYNAEEKKNSGSRKEFLKPTPEQNEYGLFTLG